SAPPARASTASPSTASVRTARTVARSAATGRRRRGRRPAFVPADGDDASRAEAAGGLERDQPRFSAAQLPPAGPAEREPRRDALLRRRDRVGPPEPRVARRLAHEVGPRIEREMDEQDRQAGDDGRGDPVEASLELPDRVDQAGERDVHAREVRECARDDDPEDEEEAVDRVADLILVPMEDRDAQEAPARDGREYDPPVVEAGGPRVANAVIDGASVDPAPRRRCDCLERE